MYITYYIYIYIWYVVFPFRWPFRLGFPSKSLPSIVLLTFTSRQNTVLRGRWCPGQPQANLGGWDTHQHHQQRGSYCRTITDGNHMEYVWNIAGILMVFCDELMKFIYETPIWWSLSKYIRTIIHHLSSPIQVDQGCITPNPSTLGAHPQHYQRLMMALVDSSCIAWTWRGHSVARGPWPRRIPSPKQGQWLDKFDDKTEATWCWSVFFKMKQNEINWFWAIRVLVRLRMLGSFSQWYFATKKLYKSSTAMDHQRLFWSVYLSITASWWSNTAGKSTI